MSLVLEERPASVSTRSACRALGLARSSAYHRRGAKARRAGRAAVTLDGRAPNPRALGAE